MRRGTWAAALELLGPQLLKVFDLTGPVIQKGSERAEQLMLTGRSARRSDNFEAFGVVQAEDPEMKLQHRLDPLPQRSP